ncbi:JmjC domain-containing protein (JMJD) [Cotesia congregata filamentous virus 1]|uniref:JmjC domain-containing protein (JMJD) n=1 Tax=Cotesia congregata filamentous virus 1 TaxID=3064291 RepID=A0ABC8QJL7_9VIRU|nr:JmjC domain-containing protein (JMJD) [Cotesia congregata filamentous virus 1]
MSIVHFLNKGLPMPVHNFFKYIKQSDRSLTDGSVVTCSVLVAQIEQNPLLNFNLNEKLPHLTTYMKKTRKSTPIYNIYREETKKALVDFNDAYADLINEYKSRPEDLFNTLPQFFSSSQTQMGYWANLSGFEQQSMLNEFCNENSLISEKLNPAVATMPGINTSMFYISMTGSFGEMHIEDSDLASINIVRDSFMVPNKNQVAKLWLIVPEKTKLIKVLHSQKKTKDTHLCDFSIFHKKIYITPEFLKAHKIYYEIIEQRVGQAIFLKPSIFHQVINVSPNVAEAINYGSLQWNDVAQGIFACACEESKYATIQPNQDILISRKISNRKVYVCEHCPVKFLNFKIWGKHMYVEHKVEKPFICDLCKKKFKTYSGLHEHFCETLIKEKAAKDVSIILKDLKDKYKPYYCNVCKLYLRGSKKVHESRAQHRRLAQGVSGPVIEKNTQLNLKRCNKCFISFTSHER